MKNNNIRRKKFWLISILLNINLIFCAEPIKAFIPNTYTPSKKTLINTSLGIGYTASEYIKRGQIKEAIELAKLSVSLNPQETDLWIILSTAQLNNQLFEESLKSIEKAKEINPNLANIWFTQASIEMQMGNTKSAINSINKYLTIDKTNHNSYFLLGNANLIQKQHKKALKAFEKAKNINPQFWQAINNQGLIYFELGEKRKAINTWRKVLRIKSDPEPKLALAIALYSITPNNSESIPLASAALKENPNYLFEEHQKEQLWGEKLQLAGKELFKNPKLKNVISTAAANSDFTNEKEP